LKERYPEKVAAKLQFKFRQDTSDPDRHQLIVTLEDNGALDVTPLFPDSADDELGSLYSVQVRNSRQLSKLLGLLKRSRTIEFAEPAVERRLIMPR
jgi:hypothetical protein